VYKNIQSNLPADGYELTVALLPCVHCPPPQYPAAKFCYLEPCDNLHCINCVKESEAFLISSQLASNNSRFTIASIYTVHVVLELFASIVSHSKSKQENPGAVEKATRITREI